MGGSTSSGKKRPRSRLALFEASASRAPLGSAELVGVHTGPHPSPPTRVLTLLRALSGRRASPSFCSTLFCPLTTCARALCIPDSSPGLRGSWGPSAQVAKRPPRAPSSAPTAPRLLPTRTPPQDSPPECPLGNLPSPQPHPGSDPSALLPQGAVLPLLLGSLKVWPFPCSVPSWRLTPAGEGSPHRNRHETTFQFGNTLLLQDRIYSLSGRQSWYVDGNSKSLVSKFLPVLAETAV